MRDDLRCKKYLPLFSGGAYLDSPTVAHNILRHVNVLSSVKEANPSSVEININRQGHKDNVHSSARSKRPKLGFNFFKLPGNNWAVIIH